MVKSSPGVTPKPRFGPNLDSTGGDLAGTGATALSDLGAAATGALAFTRYCCHQ